MIQKYLPRNPLFRLLLINGLIGTGVALFLVAGLMVTDAHRIGTLILQSEHPILPIVVLSCGLIITFGSVAMGMAIMSLPYEDDKADNGGMRSRKSGVLQNLFAPMVLRPVAVPAARPDRPRN